VAPDDEVVGQAGAGGQIQNLQVVFDKAEWRTTGTVAYGGSAELGLGWTCQDIADLCPLDGSDYAGIQFTIHRNGGSVESADFFMDRNDDDTSEHAILCGTCVETTDSAFPTACLSPRATIAITQTPTVVTLRWSDFIGGLPHASADPAQITGMYIFLHPGPAPDGGAGGTYEIDLTIDDIQFIPL
jgi:hypothetical protein